METRLRKPIKQAFLTVITTKELLVVIFVGQWFQICSNTIYTLKNGIKGVHVIIVRSY